jgi:ketosteroid isomerase-like protein
MGTSSDFVKSLYDAFAKGDVATVVGALDGAVQWREAENYPYATGNPYVGPEAVVEGVFKPLVADMDGFTIHPANFIDGGETVVVEGRYRGTMKATGKSLDAQFAHVWQLRGGKVVRFQQYTDSKQWSEVAT